MKLIKRYGPESGGGGWVKPFLNGSMEQKTYGLKVGHVLSRGFPGDIRWMAFFDGRHIGTYAKVEKAKDAVDAIGNEWLR